MDPAADPASSPTTTDDSPINTPPVQTPAPVPDTQPVAPTPPPVQPVLAPTPPPVQPVAPTPPPVAPVAPPPPPPPTGFPTLVVYTDSPTDEPVAGTLPPSTDRPSSSSSSSLISTSEPTPAPVASTLLPTSPSSPAADPTPAPTASETQAIATFDPSPYPTPGSEPVPLSPFLDTAAPVELTPAPAPAPSPAQNIPWTPPPVSPPDPTPAPVDHVPWTPPPDPTPAPVDHVPWTPPPDDTPAPTSPPQGVDTSEPTRDDDDSGPEGTAAPEAPTPRPAAPSPPSDPSPAGPTPRPSRRPTRPAADPAEPTDRPQQPPQDEGDNEGGGGGVRPSPTDEPSGNLAQRPSPSPSSTSSPTRQDENSATAPVTAPTAALGYSYDMVRVGREGLEMSIALSQSSQRRLGSGLRLAFLTGWSGAAPRRRDLQEGGVQDAALCTEVWAKYMEDIIRYSVNQAIRSVELVDVEIQNVALDRLLEEAALVFFFDVQIRIRSPPTEHDVDKYVSAPFDTDQEKQSFVDYLRNSDCKEFKYATSVTLILPPSSNSVESYSSRPANTGLIVGIAAAAVAFAMLVALFAYMKIKARRSYRYQDDEKVLAVLEEQPTHDYASEIGMRTSADISTLSDPVPLGAVAPASRDGSTAGSFTLDYDFQKAYQASVSEMSGGSHHDTASRDYFSTDDGSLEAQYVADEQVEVIAPSGVLGLILETNEDGIPIVNNVKASSVLTGQVHVGDRLLSVDGQDVTVMLASDVSKLIAFKKHKPERRLLFARSTRGRISSSKEVLLNEMDVNQDQASWMQGSTRSR